RRVAAAGGSPPPPSPLPHGARARSGARRDRPARPCARPVRGRGGAPRPPGPRERPPRGGGTRPPPPPPRPPGRPRPLSGRRRAVHARYAEVADRALHPDELLLFSELQRRERVERNVRTEDPRFQIPEPFDEAQPVAWTEAWSLAADEPRLLPSAYCYIGYPL